MKAVILAGGEGTRLRPLTLSLPKPVVPVVDRPFLTHQLDLLSRVGVTEVVFSVAYQPERIRRVFGDGGATGRRIHYAAEDTPLGTGGAVRNAFSFLDDTTIVFNGDVLTDVDLPAAVKRHRETGARATLVLTPVSNPSAYGLVETGADGRVLRFVEKPQPSQITTDTINAGIYILETAAIERMPPGINYSMERGFFPGLLERGEHVGAFVHRGYWIDIGTPEKYLKVHRDILDGSYPVEVDGQPRGGGHVHSSAHVEDGAELAGPFYIGPECVVRSGAAIGPHAVLTRNVTVEPAARVRDSVVWEGTRIAAGATLEGALVGAGVTVGRYASAGAGAVLGEGTQLTDFSRTA